MRVLVCGGRDYTDSAFVDFVLDSLHAKKPIELIIQGEAQGADTFAKKWAEKTPGCTSYGVPADWKAHGNRAGPIRNRQMLEYGKPNLVVAFEGGAGTRDMCAAATSAGVKVIFAEKLQPDFKPSKSEKAACGCDALPWEDCEHTRKEKR